MRQELQDEISRVDSSLVTMGKAVRNAMRMAGNALLTADYTQAQQVVENDAEIDVLYRVVEDRVYGMVAREQPVTRDLRMATTAVHVASDLARMGDLAVHVARVTLRRHPVPAVVPELADLFRSMHAVADMLAVKVVVSLANRDMELAAQVDRDDDVMDELHRKLFEVMLSPEWPLGVEAAIDGALLGRYYERYADHAVNIGRHIVILGSQQ